MVWRFGDNVIGIGNKQLQVWGKGVRFESGPADTSFRGERYEKSERERKNEEGPSMKGKQ